MVTTYCYFMVQKKQLSTKALYINVLQNCMSSVQRLFTDVTTVVVRADSLQSLKIYLNSELPKINTWMNKNKLTKNSTKSYALVIPPILAVNTSSIKIRFNSSRIEAIDCINY